MALDLEDYHPSVLLHCWLGHLISKIVSEMTYNVSSGTLNRTIPYYFNHSCSIIKYGFPQTNCPFNTHGTTMNSTDTERRAGPSAIAKRLVVKIWCGKQTDTQTNEGKNPTPSTAVGMCSKLCVNLLKRCLSYPLSTFWCRSLQFLHVRSHLRGLTVGRSLAILKVAGSNLGQSASR